MSDEILELLRTLPLTRHFSEDLMRELAPLAQPCRLRHRERIVTKGDEILGIHLVSEGAVLLEMAGTADKSRIVHQVLPGESFGDLLLLDDVRSYPFDATATEPGTEVLLFPREPLQELWQRQPEFPKLVTNALSHKAKVFFQRLSDLLVTSATTRLARYLLERTRDESGSHPEVDLGLDRRDLAALLAITPEHLSRILRRWTEAGLISPIGRSIEIAKLDVIVAIADLDDPAEG
jgi:CRP-like cAMP-binding protein